MNNNFGNIVITNLSIMVWLLLETSAQAQFSIPWFTVDGGGGRSAAANLELMGTIGQHDAGGPMNGGGFSLTGGFGRFRRIRLSLAMSTAMVKLICRTSLRSSMRLPVEHSFRKLILIWMVKSTCWTSYPLLIY